MAETERLPGIIIKIQHSLEPFVKSRHEIIGIRRALGAHLGSHVRNTEDGPLCRPLSLVDSTHNVDNSPHGLRGLPREYLRCVRANTKARTEYSRLRRDHQVIAEHPGVQTEDSRFPAMGESNTSTESFVDLVKNREKHERLRIIQDYIDLMAQKPAATLEHLDPKVVLNDLDSLPRVPEEVMNMSGSHRDIVSSDLRVLVEQLEKSVLRAKILSKREQKLLAKVKTSKMAPSVSPRVRLEALGNARNELINWIETELATAGEVSGEMDDNAASSNKIGSTDIESQLISVQRRYLSYTKARQSLILTTTMKIDPPVNAKSDTILTIAEVKETPQHPNKMHVLYPYLENIVQFSNEQKAFIQQKSYLTISLAKQLKEAGQGLERLAGESHLLTSHPISRSIPQGSGLSGQSSFGDAMSNQETPDSSRRARTWVFATQSARKLTARTVSERVVEGDTALTNAKEVLLDLQYLLGNQAESGGPIENLSTNLTAKRMPQAVWATIDGNLGAIKNDDVGAG